MMTGTRSEGIFTPPSDEGSIVYPGSVGGTNWGGASVDGDHGILVTSVNRLVQVVRVIARDNLRAASDSGRRFGLEFASQRGTPYGMSRRFLIGPKAFRAIHLHGESSLPSISRAAQSDGRFHWE